LSSEVFALLLLFCFIGKIQPSMAADGHFASQNVLLATLASLPPSLRHGWIFPLKMH